MRLRTALDEYKRRRDDRLPGECRTVAGVFSGDGGRLVHVDPAGSIRDYSAALSGLHGVERSRFGIETGERRRWFDERAVRQEYDRDTTLVETEHDAGEYTVTQYDLTLGRRHLTHFEFDGGVPADARVTAALSLAPEGRESQIGRLDHEHEKPRVVEAFHRQERDFVTASTGIETVTGQVPERFDELLDDDPVEFPGAAAPDRYETAHLSGTFVLSVPLETTGSGARTTLVTRLSEREETSREEALADVRATAAEYDDASSLRDAAREHASAHRSDADREPSRVVTADRRALSLLRAPAGGRIAAPEFDHFFVNTGGYGYTWFRDDAETSLSLLAASDRLPLDADDELARSAALYCDSQLEDGTWTHRLWAVDGSIAPGWAHARLEGADSPEYQADQTASVVAFLATLLRERADRLDADLPGRIRESLDAGLDGLDATLGDDGLPERCQNCWENMDGRFAHTAATFLRAYAAIEASPVDEELTRRAADSRERVLEGLEALWTGDRYALRLDEDERDERLDSATFALVDAFAAVDGVDEETLDRLRTHVRTTIDGLHHETESVAGLVRFEGDPWRTADQGGEKVWSLSTAWGALACTRLASMLEARGADPAPFYDRGRELYELVLPGGPLCTDVGYLPEQVFDDGAPDSATPLGWSHALRLETTARLAAAGELPSHPAVPDGY